MKKLKLLNLSLFILFLFGVSSCKAVKSENSTFKYKHDPKLNTYAMVDIIVNEKAVYGFSPNPDSGSLKQFALPFYDWTDKSKVQEYKNKRIEYHKQFDKMKELHNEMKSEGKTTEEIARALCGMRNKIRLNSYESGSKELENVKKRNLEIYGNEEGPSSEWCFEKYGSWENVIIKAYSPNVGMDACCGLYDEYFDFYVMLGISK